MRLLAALLVLCSACWASGPDKPKSLRSELSNLEKQVNARLNAMFPEEPWLVLGLSRGLYVEGVGLVFSAEVNLATGPTQLFNQPTREQIAALHEKRIARLPKLRETMNQVLKEIATVPAIGPDEQVIFGVTVLRYPYETYTDLPSQIVLHAPKSKLASAKLEEY
jgi:hypothetical protein